ncbi:hypothetical protein [Nocardiopsis sp. CA-288880]|uniref:hypothetical protein n=1 Tax=Nocardiopsis sp. CA-288880 TaxID=3239995 RepID=UPI003D9766DA
MIVVDFEALEFPDEWSAEYDGAPFTGYSLEKEDGYSSFQLFISGKANGPDYILTKVGFLVSCGNRTRIGRLLGASYDWDVDGNLISETIKDEEGVVHIDRRWESSGALVEGSDCISRNITGRGSEASAPWLRTPPVVAPQDAQSGRFSEAVSVEGLEISPENQALLLHGENFTGRAFHQETDGRSETYTVVDGFEHGPVLKWSASGRLVTQGLRRHPHGAVGPWHEWDEEGRLLSETIYDTLGNRIIHRELDDQCNIVRQERFEPRTLLRSPETGEEHPAPWL